MHSVGQRCGSAGTLSGLQTRAGGQQRLHVSLCLSKTEVFSMAFAKTQEREQPEFSNRPQPIRGMMGATIPCGTNSLLKRCLGSSGLEITTVGFGAWALGGGDWVFGWGPQDDNASVATMRRALELGVNWIDTAAIYGLGHSEEVVGRLLRELPASERPLIFTKCGLIWDEHNRMAEPRRVLKPESIRQECEASLRRLGVERIDLYQFHWPDEAGNPVEGFCRAMGPLGAGGKSRQTGVLLLTVVIV